MEMRGSKSEMRELARLMERDPAALMKELGREMPNDLRSVSIRQDDHQWGVIIDALRLASDA
jgi:hypothetical protein